MSERDGFEPGVPCWVDTRQPNPQAAVDFYTQLFGWEAESNGEYAFCRLRGRDVAAITAGEAPAWTTHIWVDDADATAAQAQDAGGRIVAAPFDVPGVGRTADLADPAGAEFSVWQPDGHKGARRVNEPGAWSMSSLSTPDLDGAKAFYGTVFGWETDTFSMGEMSVTLWRLPGFEGGEPEQPVPADVIATSAPSDVPAQWGVDFSVDDADATAQRARELGGTVIVAPFDLPIGKSAVLADPQGATFSISRVVPA
jgi:predicted enzyme related to lactoylglutathione lyase